ncbi:DNA polymerase I [Rubritalea marina]|uniref:DNA polymerase I n=1 Tax=Rubritalea marina TaxID=361055 RepID=UPI00037C4890|nr:DNA polymerase I [Rubritalea marina]
MASSEKRLFLLDGMALVYRAHFALIRNPIYNSKGMNTSAVFGFINTLLDILENHQPTHLGVAFDTKAPTPRHKIFPEYKAQREAMPEDLAKAIPEVKRLLEAFHIPVIELDGFEADDIIGTLALKADQEGSFHTFMVTPDKDYAQLVSEGTTMWKPGRKGSDVELLDVPAILEKWEIEHPKQVIDILALWGDASDNIPGVPGVGEKTAKKLIKQFGSVEALLESTEQLKGKQKENVENNKEQALLSKTLTTIILDVPVDTTFDQLLLGTRDDAAIQSLFTELEFNSLGKRLFGNDFRAGRGHSTTSAGSLEQADLLQAELKTFSDFKTNYQLVDTPEALTKLARNLEKQDLWCFDLETTALNPRTADILGIAISWKAREAYFVTPNPSLSLEQILTTLGAAFKSSATKIGHNLKFDLSVMLAQGADVAPPFFDTMLAHSLVDPDQRHNMDFLAESILGYTPIKLSEVAAENPSPDQESPGLGDDLFSFAEKKKTKKKDFIDMTAIPAKALTNYACEDADITFQLAEILAEKLDESGQSEVFYEIESPLLPVLVRIEHEGISVNKDGLGTIGETLATKIESLTKSIYQQAGKEFNLKSPKQLGEILFGEMQLVEKPKKTKTGQFKTDESTLSTLAPKHPIVAEILEFREATKLKSTYVDALPEHICPSDGRIHTHLHQLMTATGRLASSDPNLQNIPIRSEAGREIRKAFIPRGDDFTLLACDYSQVELRVMAAISGDQAMIEAFQNDQDIHSATAAKVFGVEIDEVTRDMRATAKMVNFGIIYGISAFGLSQRLGIPRGEAGEIIDTYFKQYPAIKDFMENTIEQAEQDGFVTTLSGRKRVLRDITSRNGMTRKNAERAAINTPIQGTGADMIKHAMIKVDELLRTGKYRTKMILQVHDELIFDLALDEQDELVPKILEAMQSALPLPHQVPAKTDAGTGNNWLEAH